MFKLQRVTRNLGERLDWGPFRLEWTTDPKALLLLHLLHSTIPYFRVRDLFPSVFTDGRYHYLVMTLPPGLNKLVVWLGVTFTRFEPDWQ